MDFQEKGVEGKLTVGSAVAIHYMANKELYTRRWSSQSGSERILQLAPERFTGPTCNVSSISVVIFKDTGFLPKLLLEFLAGNVWTQIKHGGERPVYTLLITMVK